MAEETNFITTLDIRLQKFFVKFVVTFLVGTVDIIISSIIKGYDWLMVQQDFLDTLVSCQFIDLFLLSRIYQTISHAMKWRIYLDLLVAYFYLHTASYKRSAKRPIVVVWFSRWISPKKWPGFEETWYRYHLPPVEKPLYWLRQPG